MLITLLTNGKPKSLDLGLIFCYTRAALVNNCMSEENQPRSLKDAVKSALANKHAATHPNAKGTTGKTSKPKGPPAPQGFPVRKASGRGG